MRIAIVDDAVADRDWLTGQLEQLLARRRLEGTIFPFEDAESFLAAARQERFALAFLDIYMEGMDGVSAAQEMRSFDPDCVLVFSTSSSDHALDGYRVRAVQYLVKPYQTEDLEQLFDDLVRLLPASERYLELRSGRHTFRIRLRDILWAEHFQHQVLIHTAGGKELSTRLTFGKFSSLLSSDSRFFVCSRGLLVNLDYAADFDGNEFLLLSGQRLPVARDLSGAARSAFGDRLFQTGKEPAL